MKEKMKWKKDVKKTAGKTIIDEENDKKNT